MTAFATASDVAVNILTRLAAEDLSVAWLADRVGTTVEQLHRALEGDEPLTLFHAILIADALDTTPPELAAIPLLAMS